MIHYDPVTALLLFALLMWVLFLAFRPERGWYWRYRKRKDFDERVLLEDVLKQLYHFEASGMEVNLKSLSGALKMTDNELVEVVKRLTEKDLVISSGDTIRLTEAGKTYALKIIRVHRLWEKYLAENTGYHKTEWHDRAEKMEHLLSEEETEQLVQKLRNPLYDPHGDPIPSETGKMAEMKGIPLSDLSDGTTGTIVHIEDEPDAVYRQILDADIHIGSGIRVEKNARNRVVFRSEGQDFNLAPIVAANISVLPSKDPETEQTVRLNRLKKGEEAVITEISKEMRGEGRRRLLDLGFVKGAGIRVDLESPMGNTRAYLIKGTAIALRDEQASMILIKKVKK